MTTTVAQVLADSRNYLMGATHDVTNTLSTTISSNATTSVVFATNDSKLLPAVGSTIEIDTEVMYVTAMSSNTATVIRGYLGSTIANHTSGAVIRVDPKFYDAVNLRYLNNELADLTAPDNGLFKQAHVDVTYNSAVAGYDLTSTSTIIDILDVRVATSGPWKNWPRTDWEWARDMLTTDFASGNAIIIKGRAEVGRTIRVWYKAPYTAVSATSDTLESTAGMHAEATDIPAVGVAIRAMSGQEIARNFIQAQGDTRRAAEVPAGANNQASAGLRQVRAQRIAAEAARLAAYWPGFRRHN